MAGMTLIEPRRVPPIGFAHRGARAHARENTIEAFELALRLGATGLESDVWITADGVPVLDHDGIVRNGLRRRRIADLDRSQLPDHVPALAELFASLGTEFELSLDLKDPAAGRATVEVASAADPTMPDRLWMCGEDPEQLTTLRDVSSHVRLVCSTRLAKLRHGPERLAAQLQPLGVDAVNLHHTDWTGGLVTLFHRFKVLAFGWDAQHERILDGLLTMGIDALYSDHVDRLVDAMHRDARRRGREHGGLDREGRGRGRGPEGPSGDIPGGPAVEEGP